jgi:hypothetical protein
VKRHTFVVQVHPEGISTLEDLSTHELVRLENLAEIGPQIERWLADQPSAMTAVPDPPQRGTERARHGSPPE